MSLAELEDFARDCINADNHQADDHIFIMYQCHSCKRDSFILSIEHHTGSEEWNFKGIIWGECTNCGYLGRLFTFTGEHRKKLREEKPVCECGNRSFVVGQCERIEGEQGIPGFFDKGVIVGKCCNCHRNTSFVFTD
jgi:hypothetical protein